MPNFGHKKADASFHKYHFFITASQISKQGYDRSQTGHWLTEQDVSRVLEEPERSSRNGIVIQLYNSETLYVRP